MTAIAKTHATFSPAARESIAWLKALGPDLPTYTESAEKLRPLFGVSLDIEYFCDAEKAEYREAFDEALWVLQATARIGNICMHYLPAAA